MSISTQQHYSIT
uniref:Uncharacterized protein n=1 Tax=Anguilla anguilla TaxID=7936 RepID=A0A0E9SQ25_ANGAN